MAHLSLYRKYRSQTFADLVGQNHVVRTLQNAIASGRFAHAYLFTGPRGTGKTSTARLLAKALCCEKGPTPEPCNQCANCRDITLGSFMDVVEMDAASESGVEEVREAIVEVVGILPAIAKYRVFIIDEVHDLSPKAFDALLKTIEEPPPHLVFVLATTEYGKVPPTIRSRCQKYEFHRASVQDLVKRLGYVAEQEGVTVEPAAIYAIARMADGGYRDALNLLEQAILTADGAITLQSVYDQLGLVVEEAVDTLLDAIARHDVPKLVTSLSEMLRSGRDPQAILESMLHRLADLTSASYGLDVAGPGEGNWSATLHETAARLGQAAILGMRGGIAEAHREIRGITLPRLWLESELIRLSGQLTQPVAPVAVAAVPQPTSGAGPGTAPKPAARPVERSPEPEAPVVAEAAPVDPQLKRAAQVWSAVVRTIEQNPKSKAMAMKLANARPTRFEGNKVWIEFSRRIEYESVLEDPKDGEMRRKRLLKMIQDQAGEEWDVEFGVGRRTAGPSHDLPAVELTVEGQELLDAARDVFNS